MFIVHRLEKFTNSLAKNLVVLKLVVFSLMF